MPGKREAAARWDMAQRALRSRGAFLVGLLIAGWPVLRWYVFRMTDGSEEEPWGWAALAAALGFAARQNWNEALSTRRQAGLAVALLVYGAAFPFVPPLLRAAVWLAAVCVCVAPGRTFAAWSLLAGLSLPVVPTLQFYLGYPLRVLTTACASVLLRACGVPATAEGTLLACRGERVLIDAPCSGLQMLWTLLFLVAVLANLRSGGGRETLRLVRWASGVVFTANTLRATALFCIETRIWPGLPGGHDTVGLVLFAAAALTLVLVEPRNAFGQRKEFA